MELLYPVVPFPERALALRAAVRAFLAKRTFDQATEGFSPELSRALGERGWLGVTWPKTYGGQEWGLLERFVITEELVAAGAPVWAHFIAERQSGPLLLRFGTEEQRRTFLPSIARGECYFAIGMSEPDAGSDLAAVRTRATRVDGGWLLNGRKIWNSFTHLCHGMIALVRTSPPDEKDRHAGLSQMIVELRTTKGVHIKPIINLAGRHHFNETTFEDAFIPDERVVGEVGNGWQQVTSELAHERSGPERFLGVFPLLKKLLERCEPEAHADIGRLVAHLFVLRRMSASIAGQWQQGATPAIEAALVKDLATIYAKEVAEVARLAAPVEADPEDEEDPYTRMLAHTVLHAPSFTLAGGTTEVLRGMIARGLEEVPSR